MGVFRAPSEILSNVEPIHSSCWSSCWEIAFWKAFPQSETIQFELPERNPKLFALRMALSAGRDFNAMFEERKNRNQAFFRAPLAAGQVDDEHASHEAGHAPRKPREGIASGAKRTHGLG